MAVEVPIAGKEIPIVGQERVVTALSNAMLADRLGHGLLFVGPEGVGRETTARALAAALLCITEAQSAYRPGPWGCGHCNVCHRVRSGTHPDVLVTMPDAIAAARGLPLSGDQPTPSREIRIDQIRELAREMRMRPFEGHRRVAIVVNAHQLNANAANAFLKTLEEPGGDNILILIAPHDRAVLPTLVSRCQRLLFAPLSAPQVETVLSRLGVDDAAARASWAQGSVETALQDDSGDGGDSRAEAAAFLEALRFATGEQKLDAAERVGTNRIEVIAMLLQVQTLLEMEMRRAPHGSASVRELLVQVGRARAEIAANAQVKLALEALFLQLPLAVLSVRAPSAILPREAQ